MTRLWSHVCGYWLGGRMMSRVMSHMWMHHVTHVHSSCHTCECVSSHMWMHVARVNASCHIHEWVVSHVNFSCQTLGEPGSRRPSVYLRPLLLILALLPGAHILWTSNSFVEPWFDNSKEYESPYFSLTPFSPLILLFIFNSSSQHCEKSVDPTLSFSPPDSTQELQRIFISRFEAVQVIHFLFPLLEFSIFILLATLWNLRRELHDSTCIESYDRWEKFVLFYSNVTHSTIKTALDIYVCEIQYINFNSLQPDSQCYPSFTLFRPELSSLRVPIIWVSCHSTWFEEGFLRVIDTQKFQFYIHFKFGIGILITGSDRTICDYTLITCRIVNSVFATEQLFGVIWIRYCEFAFVYVCASARTYAHTLTHIQTHNIHYKFCMNVWDGPRRAKGVSRNLNLLGLSLHIFKQIV